MTTDPLDRYPAMMSPAEVAEYMGVDKALLAQWRWRGDGPPYVKMTPGRQGLVRYPREELREYIAARRKGIDVQSQPVTS